MAAKIGYLFMNPYESSPRQPVGAPTSLRRIVLDVLLFAFGMAAFFLIVFVGPLAWIMRDGLGPDATTSSGWRSCMEMFWCFHWGPATLTISVLFLVTFYYRRQLASE